MLYFFSFLSLGTALCQLDHDGRSVVSHISYQKKKKKKKNEFLTMPPADLMHLQEVHRGGQSKPSPCPTLGYYILALNPSTHPLSDDKKTNFIKTHFLSGMIDEQMTT